MLRLRIIKSAGLLLILGLFIFALVLLQQQLDQLQIHDIKSAINGFSWQQLGLASILTIASYSSLTLYDRLALVYLRKPLPFLQTALASFLGYVFSYNIGLSVLGGGTIRYRLYTLWGLKVGEVTKLIAFAALTFWIGLFALSGIAFIFAPLPIPPFLNLKLGETRPIGWFFVIAIGLYLILTASGHRTLSWKGKSIALPSLGVTSLQLALGMLDLVLASAVLYCLLPAAPQLSFLNFVGIYSLSMVLALISHVPGGVGVLETLMLFFLRPYMPGAPVMSALIIYRILFYLLPFGLGLLLYMAFEIRQHIGKWGYVTRRLSRQMAIISPLILAGGTFLAGLALLISGAAPVAAGRLLRLQSYVPLPVLELAHVLGSLVGVLLLVLSRGIMRKLDAAYYLTMSALAVGIIASLLKGLEFEVAIIFTMLLLAFYPSRQFFYRRASLIAKRFSLEWFLILTMVMLSTLWLGLFSFKRVVYSHELWFQFDFMNEASRSLRSNLGAVTLLLSCALWRFRLKKVPQSPSIQLFDPTEQMPKISPGA